MLQIFDFECFVGYLIIFYFIDGGHGGFSVWQLGRKFSVFIGDGESYWLAEKNLPNKILADDWFNLAFRWNKDLGLQVRI